ncbi:DUF1801 domain-containing protein [Yimella sp. cx-51]|uniref:DUF1801 domain-containing protein n=1 Tax=Yimella sp. cx-51 TaxID=2770551 RepID=UPI00165E7D3F|nr:DUF1801 domain-containing protein [Yimella sp. cx-51]MBC9957985.1 DUF1801 domain-containing protein [Yimella sp. cx-51]QTH38113.1 DUF1801 domain-containing protein [Yimella sp. cx-51]
MTTEVDEFISAVTPAVRQRDARSLLDMMARITGEQPRLWGTIVGFGSYHYKYDSGREGASAAAACAPRNAAMSVYLNDGINRHEDALARLGPHRAGVGCLYLKNLDDVDLAVLEQIVTHSYATLTAGTVGSRARDGE